MMQYCLETCGGTRWSRLVHMLYNLVMITISKQSIIERASTLHASGLISLSTLGPHLHTMLGQVIHLTLQLQLGLKTL